MNFGARLKALESSSYVPSPWPATDMEPAAARNGTMINARILLAALIGSFALGLCASGNVSDETTGLIAASH